MIEVEGAVALPARQEVLRVQLPEGASVEQALVAARVRERFPEIDWSRATYGIWARPCEARQTLREGDRVEVYRPLQADPKDQRRRRARASPSTRSRNAP